jgi:hypothetical protein
MAVSQRLLKYEGRVVAADVVVAVVSVVTLLLLSFDALRLFILLQCWS